MSTTNPYFIRHDDGDTPGHNGGSFSSCPDIILSTTGDPNWTPQPIPNGYQTLLSEASYDTNYGSHVQVSPQGTINNFVYLRARNLDPGATVPTRLWMFYAESDLALWPQNWRKDSIMMQQSYQNWQDTTLMSGTAGKYGTVVVTGQPFLWAPANPKADTHYCVVSMAEPFPNADPPGSLSSPPFAPPTTIGYLHSVPELAAFVLANDWFGWRNTIDVTSLGATWQQTIPVTGPDEGGQVMVGIACTKMPTDGFVSAYMAGPDVNNTLNIPRSPITVPNMQQTVPLTLPGKFKTNMIITYWQGKTEPPVGSSVSPFLGVTSSQLATALGNRTIKRAPRWCPVFHPVTNAFLNWQRLHVFGAVPLKWDSLRPKARGLVSVSVALPDVVGAVKDNGATWQKSYPITAPGGGTFFAGYQCTNMPTDGRVALDIVGPTPDHGAELPPEMITSPNEVVTVPLNWAKDATGTLTISYWQGPTPPPAGGRIDPIVIAPAPRVATAALGGPTWQQEFPVEGLEQAARVYIGIRCTNMPTDGFIGASLSHGDLTIPKMSIAQPNLTVAQQFDMPANYKGTLVISYWQGATRPPMGAAISPYLALPMNKT